MKPDVCYRFFVPLYEIVFYSFCTVLKYVVLEGKLCPPQCDRYPLSIHYCCPLTEAESVTKDCASRWSHLQNGQASLRKRVWMSGRELQLPENVQFNYTVLYLVWTPGYKYDINLHQKIIFKVYVLQQFISTTKTVTCLLLIQNGVCAGKINESIPCVFPGIIYQY